MPDVSDTGLPEQVLSAVREDMSAFQPDRTPPFAALRARKRSRDRRRGGAALVATALAVAGVAFLPTVLSSSAGRTPEQVAGPAGNYYTFIVRFDDEVAYERDGGAVQGCLEASPVVRSATLGSAPPQFSGLLQGPGADQDLTECLLANARGASVESGTANQESTPADESPYRLSADGRTLTVTAAVGGGCRGRGFGTATAEESADRVVVHALVARPRDDKPVPDGTPCTADLAIQDVEVGLDEPLADRRVFDAATGAEIPGPPRRSPAAR